MAQRPDIRLGWLKLLYAYTLLGAGGLGLFILLLPRSFVALFAIPAGEPFFPGAVGSTLLAFAILAILGLRSPLQFIPILLLQMAYKTAWMVFVFIPHIFSGSLPFYAWLLAAVFLSYIVLDAIAIPFDRALGLKTSLA